MIISEVKLKKMINCLVKQYQKLEFNDENSCEKIIEKIVLSHVYEIEEHNYVISDNALSRIIIDTMTFFSKSIFENDVSICLKNIKEILIGSIQCGTNPVSRFDENEKEYHQNVRLMVEKKYDVQYIETEINSETNLKMILKYGGKLPDDVFSACLSPSLSNAIQEFCYLTNTKDYRLDVLFDKKLADQIEKKLFSC